MDFSLEQDYVDALKQLELLRLTGVAIEDGHLVFYSRYTHVDIPLHKTKGWGCGISSYGLHKLDVVVHRVSYHDHIRQVRLFDEDGNVIAHVVLGNATRQGWLFEELHDKNLHDSMNVNQYKKYVSLASGVVFTAEADGLTGVFVNWLSLDSPVERVLDQGDAIYIETAAGHAVELLFKDGDEDDE